MAASSFQKTIDSLLIRLSENRGERLPFNPVDLTHSKHHQHRNILKGVWWYNVKSKELVLSTSASSHLDKEFQTKLVGVTLSDKRAAEKLGWISGRVGIYKDDWFSFLYEKPLKSLPEDVAVSLLFALERKLNTRIRYFTDTTGHILIERAL